MLVEKIDGLTDDVVSNLHILSFLEKETNHEVWKRAHSFIKSLSKMLSKSLHHNNFWKSILKPHFDGLGFGIVDGESLDERNLRDVLMSLAREVNYEDYLDYELKRLTSFVESGKGYYNQYEGLKLANASVHSHFVEKLAASEKDSYDRYKLLDSLSCSLNREALNNFLRFSLDKNNNLTSVTKSRDIRAAKRN